MQESDYFLAIAVLVGAWLLLRQVSLWYFKINTIVKNQEILIDLEKERNKSLDRLIKNLEEDKK